MRKTKKPVVVAKSEHLDWLVHLLKSHKAIVDRLPGHVDRRHVDFWLKTFCASPPQVEPQFVGPPLKPSGYDAHKHKELSYVLGLVRRPGKQPKRIDKGQARNIEIADLMLERVLEREITGAPTWNEIAGRLEKERPDLFPDGFTAEDAQKLWGRQKRGVVRRMTRPPT